VADLLELSAEIRAGDSAAATAARTGRVGPAGRLGELAEWLEGQVAIDRVTDARAELAARGLAV